MELQFNKSSLSCLQRVACEIQNQEQTQEVRLSDGMPDIGKVLGAWGQVLVRSKEWRAGGMSVSGGGMVWILYTPEGGGAPQSVETWIPFQMKWDFPDTRQDGSICVACLLKGVDARSISARKLMARVGITIMAEAYAPGEVELCQPGELPADVCLLKKSYPMCLPREAGEKPFALDEELTLPGSCPKLGKIVRYEIQPEIIDQKVMAGKVVFRGAAIVHIVYCGEDDRFHCWDFEVPFSQFGELDQEYDQDATARVILAPTGLELEIGEEGQLHLKAGLTGQYVIYDRPMVELVEDAYSPNRSVVPQIQELRLPAVLDTCTQVFHAEQTAEADGTQVADVTFYPDHPRGLHRDGEVTLEIPGLFQMLYYDREGNLQGQTARWDGSWTINADNGSDVDASAWPTGKPQAVLGGGTASLRGDVLVEAVTTQQQGFPMVTALELGEETEPDPGRPSLILRRTAGEGLWSIAKQSGSTVEAIQKANHLQDEPEEGQILIIPVT